jgi:hypothetical protein
LLIAAKDYPTWQRHRRMFLNNLAKLDVLIKEAKSTLQRRQRTENLVSSSTPRTCYLSYPPTRFAIYAECLLASLITTVSCSIRWLSSFIDRVQALTMAVFQLYCNLDISWQLRVLLYEWVEHDHQQYTYSSGYSGTTMVLYQNKTWNDQSTFSTTPQHEVFTDASDQGWVIAWEQTLGRHLDETSARATYQL